jgi:lipoprotein-releasing system permease protein
LGFELYFAKRIIRGGKNSFSKPIIRISIVAISLGIAMMTISLAIVEGFQEEIEKKVVGFGSHIQVTNYQSKGMLEGKGISRKRAAFEEIKAIEGVEHLQAYAYKGAILQANETNYGAVLKGVSYDYNWDFFSQYLIAGERLEPDSQKVDQGVILSEHIANKLQLKLGDDLLIYFAQQPARLRKLKIKGLYNTGLGEMDEQIVLIDLAHIQKINGWEEHVVGGIEVLIQDLNDIETLNEQVYQKVDYDLSTHPITETRPDIFNWLELQDVNVIIIISLLVLVCGIDMISALLILILEKSKLIGILKAIGAKNNSIRKIFIYHAAYLIIAGLVIGNFLGIGLSLLQENLGFMRLPKEAYFIDQVPIKLNFGKLLLLNLGTLAACLLMLLIPSNIVASISPVKTLRFD